MHKEEDSLVMETRKEKQNVRFQDRTCSNGSTPHQGAAPRTTKYKVSAYLIALRPWSFTASMTPVLLGTALAYKETGQFNAWVMVVTCFTALSVHAAGNLVNTYFDYVKGVDTQNSDDRTLVDHIMTPDAVSWLGAGLYSMGCIGFVLLVWLSPARMEHLALIFFGGLSGSFLYTGGLGFKYIALGDIIIFLTFGPVTVLFSYLSQTGKLSLIPLLYAIPLALNTEAILHANNARDMESDTKSGIVTAAILLGHTGSYLMFALLIFTPYIAFFLLSFHFSKWFLLPTITIFSAFKREKEFRVRNLRHLPQKVAKINLIFGLLYACALFLSGKNQLPGLNV